MAKLAIQQTIKLKDREVETFNAWLAEAEANRFETGFIFAWKDAGAKSCRAYYKVQGKYDPNYLKPGQSYVMVN